MTSGPSSSPSPAAGWYPDPLDPSRERLWDGGQWSEQTRPTGSGSTPVTSMPVRQAARPSPVADGSATPTEVRRERSGSGWSTGSILGLGCGLLALLSVGGCVVLVGVVPLVAVRSQGAFSEEATEIAVAVPEPVPTTMMVEPGFVATTGPDGPVSDSAGPLALFGMPAEVVQPTDGDIAVLEVTVETPVDVTEPIFAAGGSDIEPGDREVVVGVPATIALRSASVDPLVMQDPFSWSIVGGSTGSDYRPAAIDCGAIDDDLTELDELGIGVGRTGVVCFVVEIEDFEHPETRVVLTAGDGAPAVWIRQLP